MIKHRRGQIAINQPPRVPCHQTGDSYRARSIGHGNSLYRCTDFTEFGALDMHEHCSRCASKVTITLRHRRFEVVNRAQHPGPPYFAQYPSPIELPPRTARQLLWLGHPPVGPEMWGAQYRETPQRVTVSVTSRVGSGHFAFDLAAQVYDV